MLGIWLRGVSDNSRVNLARPPLQRFMFGTTLPSNNSQAFRQLNRPINMGKDGGQ